jgi:hypothetical protein
MTEQEEREANELIGLLTAAVLYPDAVRNSGIAKPLLKLADKQLKAVDGTPANELQVARANLAAL